MIQKILFSTLLKRGIEAVNAQFEVNVGFVAKGDFISSKLSDRIIEFYGNFGIMNSNQMF